jgi:hypothetical protein
VAFEEQEAIPRAARSAPDTGTTSGWDPYEVWRKRVLLPRLAQDERNRLSRTAVATTLYVVPAIAPNDSPAIDWDASDTSRSDEGLRRELIGAIHWLLVAGLASTFLDHCESDRLRR